jgi:hypothetical protein
MIRGADIKKIFAKTGIRARPVIARHTQESLRTFFPNLGSTYPGVVSCSSGGNSRQWTSEWQWNGYAYRYSKATEEQQHLEEWLCDDVSRDDCPMFVIYAASDQPGNVYIHLWAHCDQRRLADALAVFVFGPGVDADYPGALKSAKRAEQWIDGRYEIKSNPERPMIFVFLDTRIPPEKNNLRPVDRYFPQLFARRNWREAKGMSSCFAVLRLCAKHDVRLLSPYLSPFHEEILQSMSGPEVAMAWVLQRGLLRNYYDPELGVQYVAGPLHSNDMYTAISSKEMSMATPERFLWHEYGPVWRRRLTALLPSGVFLGPGFSGGDRGNFPDAASAADAYLEKTKGKTETPPGGLLMRRTAVTQAIASAIDAGRPPLAFVE